MTTTKEEIQNELEKTKNAYAAMKERIAAIPSIREVEYRQMEDKTRELAEVLKETKAPFEARIKALDTEKDRTEREAWKNEMTVRSLTANLAVIDLKEPKTEVDVRNILASHGIHFGDRHNFEVIKSKLPNGVTLARSFDASTASDALAVMYLAFHGTDVVAYHFTQKSQHPGDEATYYGWIGVRLLRLNNTALVNRQSKGRYAPKYDPDTIMDNFSSIQFKEWKEVVGNMRDFVSADVDLDDDINQEVIHEDYAMSIGTSYEGRNDPKGKNYRWNNEAEKGKAARSVMTIPPVKE